MTLPTRHLALPGSYNIRDLGGYPTASGGEIAWRRFLRADSLHRLGPDGIVRLQDEGLRGVIDLRTEDELRSAPNPFAGYADMHFANLPLFDDLSPEALSQANADDDHPLVGFYMAALETRGDAIRTILSEMAGIREGAVLFNCTAGKDRTGIIAALLLGIGQVDRDQIIADYTLTAELIPDLVDEFLALSRERGGDTRSYARLLESPASTLAVTLDRLFGRHGTIEEYLGAIGLPRRDLDALRKRLTEAEPAAALKG